MLGNKNKKLVGLKYEQNKGLPKVIVKGNGRAAEEIMKRNNQNSKVPVVENKKLVDELYKLPIDADIGAELFGLVAALLVHVYAIESKYKEESDV